MLYDAWHLKLPSALVFSCTRNARFSFRCGVRPQLSVAAFCCLWLGTCASVCNVEHQDAVLKVSSVPLPRKVVADHILQGLVTTMHAEAAGVPCCCERPSAAVTLLRFADLRVFDLRRCRFWSEGSSAGAASCACSGPARSVGSGADCVCPTAGHAAVCWPPTCAATRRTHAPRLASEPVARMPDGVAVKHLHLLCLWMVHGRQIQIKHDKSICACRRTSV